MKSAETTERHDRAAGAAETAEATKPAVDSVLIERPFAMLGRNHAADHVVLDAKIGARIEAARRAARRAALADAARGDKTE